MDKHQLLKYCEAIDHFLTQPATLYVYGIAAAVERLPAHFRVDPLVRDNLENLRADMTMWSVLP
ncbi:MAG: hypothetical protein NTV22_11220 [bacterium]|nr:hypothetical protein [bacterium]